MNVRNKVVLGFLGLMLAFVFGCAKAADGPKVVLVDELIQTQTETQKDFLVRVGTELQDWAAKNKTEACGQIAANESGNWSVVIVTENAHAACGEPRGALLPGYHFIGKTIHVHPQKRTYIVNGYDEAMGDTGLALGQKVPLDPERYSDADFASGPGYLVTNGKLYYQHGKGTEEVVAELPPPNVNTVAVAQ
jgi:hypothetical protein